MPMMAVPTQSVAIDRDECLRLLAGETVGRVVFTAAAMPAAQPVAYVLDHDEVVFRAGGALSAARRDVVAFEVDDIDLGTLTGWSVLGIGETYEVRDPARLAGLTGLPPALLGIAPQQEAVIAIRLHQLDGRRIRRAEPGPVVEQAVTDLVSAAVSRRQPLTTGPDPAGAGGR